MPCICTFFIFIDTTIQMVWPLASRPADNATNWFWLYDGARWINVKRGRKGREVSEGRRNRRGIKINMYLESFELLWTFTNNYRYSCLCGWLCRFYTFIATVNALFLLFFRSSVDVFLSKLKRWTKRFIGLHCSC